LPPGALMRLGTVRLRHAGSDVAFSKDGKQVISCGCDGELRFWDTATGKLLKCKQLGGTPLLADAEDVALSANGERAAIVERFGAVRVFDTKSGKEIGRQKVEKRSFGSPTFAPDGRVLALQNEDGQGEHVLEILSSTDSFQRGRTLDGMVRSAIAFTADGKRLAALMDVDEDEDQLRIFDTATGKLLCCVESQEYPPRPALAFAPDGKTLAAGDTRRGQVHLFDAATLKEKSLLTAPPRVANGVLEWLVYSPDGRCLAGAYRDRDDESGASGIVIWNLSGAKEARCLPERAGDRARLLFAADGATLACYDDDGEIRLWDVASGRQCDRGQGHREPVGALAISPDGQILATGDTGPTVRLWEAATGKPLAVLAGDNNGTHACLFSPIGREMITAGASGVLQVWDVRARKEIRRFQLTWAARNSLMLLAAGLSLDGQRVSAIASVSEDYTARLTVWDAAIGRQQLQRRHSLLFELRRINDGIEDKRSDDPVILLPYAALAPDGECAAADRNSRVDLVDIRTNSRLATLPKDARAPLIYSPDSRLVAATIFHKRDGREQAKGLSLIETASGAEVARLDIGAVTHTVFTPDGRQLVCTDEKSLKVFDVFTGERLHQRTWPQGIVDRRGESKVCSLTVLRNGRAATGMREGDILLWDLAAATWPKRPQPRDPDLKEQEALWSDLAGDARTAYRAVVRLTDAPARTVLFLSERLRPMSRDSKGIEKLLADLQSDRFEARVAAAEGLSRMRYRAGPRMRRVLENKPSLELRLRLEDILAQPNPTPAQALRMLRAIAVLERIGTPEARRILEKLAGGMAAPETRAAQAALQRLKYRDAWTKGRSLP